MRNPAIIGAGHTKFAKHDALNTEDLLVMAVTEALDDAAIGGEDIDAVCVGHFNSGMVPDGFPSSLAIQADPALRFKPATRYENACASGSAAIYAALDRIAAGRAELVLVVGVEKMTGLDTAGVTRALAGAGYQSDPAEAGIGFPQIFADFAKAYFERFGDHGEALAQIAAKNHKNGCDNPLAQLQRDLGFEFCNTVSEKNPYIAAPLRKTDCSLISDGAAALVIASPERAAQAKRAVGFRATAQVNDQLPMKGRDLPGFEGPKRAFAQAMKAAGVTLSDLDFAEVHDCFTIAELLSYEAMGLAETGQGKRALDDGTVFPGGALPVNLSGGLKSKGHPVGATGVSMHALAFRQLTGNPIGVAAGDNPQMGAVFNMGGAAVASYVSILEAQR